MNSRFMLCSRIIMGLGFQKPVEKELIKYRKGGKAVGQGTHTDGPWFLFAFSRFP